MFNRCYARPAQIANVPFQDGMIDIDNNSGNIDIDLMQSQTSVKEEMGGPIQSQQPIVEPVRERVVNRTIEHIVPHVCPIRTRIINRHVYKHTYQPSYSCLEENVCCNVQCGSCCKF